MLYSFIQSEPFLCDAFETALLTRSCHCTTNIKHDDDLSFLTCIIIDFREKRTYWCLWTELNHSNHEIIFFWLVTSLKRNSSSVDHLCYCLQFWCTLEVDERGRAGTGRGSSAPVWLARSVTWSCCSNWCSSTPLNFLSRPPARCLSGDSDTHTHTQSLLISVSTSSPWQKV